MKFRIGEMVQAAGGRWRITGRRATDGRYTLDPVSDRAHEFARRLRDRSDPVALRGSSLLSLDAPGGGRA